MTLNPNQLLFPLQDSATAPTSLRPSGTRALLPSQSLQNARSLTDAVANALLQVDGQLRLLGSTEAVPAGDQAGPRGPQPVFTRNSTMQRAREQQLLQQQSGLSKSQAGSSALPWLWEGPLTKDPAGTGTNPGDRSLAILRASMSSSGLPLQPSSSLLRASFSATPELPLQGLNPLSLSACGWPSPTGRPPVISNQGPSSPAPGARSGAGAGAAVGEERSSARGPQGRQLQGQVQRAQQQGQQQGQAGESLWRIPSLGQEVLTLEPEAVQQQQTQPHQVALPPLQSVQGQGQRQQGQQQQGQKQQGQQHAALKGEHVRLQRVRRGERPTRQWSHSYSGVPGELGDGRAAPPPQYSSQVTTTSKGQSRGSQGHGHASGSSRVASKPGSRHASRPTSRHASRPDSGCESGDSDWSGQAEVGSRRGFVAKGKGSGKSRASAKSSRTDITFALLRMGQGDSEDEEEDKEEGQGSNGAEASAPIDWAGDGEGLLIGSNLLSQLALVSPSEAQAGVEGHRTYRGSLLPRFADDDPQRASGSMSRTRALQKRKSANGNTLRDREKDGPGHGQGLAKQLPKSLDRAVVLGEGPPLLAAAPGAAGGAVGGVGGGSAGAVLVVPTSLPSAAPPEGPPPSSTSPSSIRAQRFQQQQQCSGAI